jgi:hypothetical protein
MNTQSLDLLANASATGASMTWRGGKGSFLVRAASYGTVTLQFLGPDGTTWIAAGSDTTLTADGGGNFELPPGQIRAAISGATGVYAKAVSTQ